MAIEVKIPAVGESITSGIVSAWHKKSGDFVNEGEALFTLETDKVSTDIVAEKSGVLETKVPEGQEVKIGEIVAVIDDSKGASQEKKSAAIASKKKASEEKQAVAAGAAGGVSATPTKPAQPQSTPAATEISPAVRRILEEEGIGPEQVTG